MLNCHDGNYGQGQLWMPFWPQDPYGLGPQLGPMAEILDQPEIFEPFVERYQKAAMATGLRLTGRKTIPIRTFTGMMVLKFMYGLSYRQLCEEIADRMTWRVFCRIPFGHKVPEFSTICKLTKRFGSEAVDEMNVALLTHLKDKKKLKSKKIKIDTTVVESNIEHPTDAQLLKQGMKKLGRLAERCRKAGLPSAKKFVNHWRSAKKHLMEINKIASRRSGKAIKEIDQITSKLTVLAEDTLRQARRVLRAAKTSLAHGSSRLKAKMVNEMSETCVLLERAISQAWQVVSGQRHIKDRLLSIHDPGARPIRKGKKHKPTEFGRKVLLHSNEQHLITGYAVLEGNPSDDSLFGMAVEQYTANMGSPPVEAAADRGVASAENERQAPGMGIKRASLPKRGKKSKSRLAYEKQSWFRRLQRMRAGQEAEISVLKRRFGLDKSLSRGTPGTKTWVGWGVMAYNLRLAAQL